MDAVAAVAATGSNTSVKFLSWGLFTLVILGLAVQFGLGLKPLITAQNPRAPSFAFGPIPGSVTQSIAYPGGPLESVSIWASSSGAAPQLAELHLLGSADGQPIRSALFHARPGADLQQTTIGFVPTDVPAGPIRVRIVVPEESQAQIYVGATHNDAYQGGRLIDDSGHATLGVDLVFETTGQAGALARLQAQARQAPIYLTAGMAVALLVGSMVGSAAWSSLDRLRFGRLAAASVSCGIIAAIFVALLHGPDALA